MDQIKNRSLDHTVAPTLVQSGLKLTVAIAFAVCMLGLGGCNTIEGLGKDVSAAGQGLANSAKDANPMVR